eukprot:scaffold106932_cov64-Phaeocystis_antarctica.AAC.5
MHAHVFEASDRHSRPPLLELHPYDSQRRLRQGRRVVVRFGADTQGLLVRRRGTVCRPHAHDGGYAEEHARRDEHDACEECRAREGRGLQDRASPVCPPDQLARVVRLATVIVRDAVLPAHRITVVLRAADQPPHHARLGESVPEALLRYVRLPVLLQHRPLRLRGLLQHRH